LPSRVPPRRGGYRRDQLGFARSNGVHHDQAAAPWWFPGIDFEQQELVELSIVTVPDPGR
jgi:hypothetical protein